MSEETIRALLLCGIVLGCGHESDRRGDSVAQAASGKGQGSMSKITEQFDAAAELSRRAFAAGDVVTGIAAVKLAAQLVQIMRLLDPAENCGCEPGRHNERGYVNDLRQ